MWTLNKPSLRKTIGKDIDELVAHCNMLEDTDKPIIKKLYRDYEQRGGNVTDAQLSMISDDKAKAIQGQYPKTYDGGALNYIRKELIAHAQLCPCCSNSSDFTLDHYMPQSSYKALSVCRLNLIPMCGVCNNLKNGKTYSDFLHAYYDRVPEKGIIKATPFIGTFDLQWIDSEKEIIPDEGYATFEEGILTINLPINGTSVRFYKL